MHTDIDCFPCFLKQTIIALRSSRSLHVDHAAIMKEVLSVMQEADTSKPPAFTTTFIHRIIRNGLGLHPFRELKAAYNEVALGLYPELKDKVKNSEDPVHTAARLAIAGNVIDFGIFTSIDVESSISRALEDHIAVDDYPSFREAVSGSHEILYLLDNSGEIVFDRLLIEELVEAGKMVKAVVKGSPVLNDATLNDALQTDLTKICEVIDNGSDAIGTILEWTSPEFRKQFNIAELVISKGQGNFETLSGTDKKTFFLFQSKCDVVSKELGLSPGSMLLKKS